MIIKAIDLKNIRSHVSSSVEFKQGINVIIGNTGSGKSSILMAIEYALFGDINEGRGWGKMLLRRGASSGSISIDILDGDDKFTVKRGIKRISDSVRNDDSKNRIMKNGNDIDILNRSNDLNEYVRRILGFSSEDPLKIFEAITYIKQDELKELILDTTQKKQQYIDELLQIDKYEKTYEAMRDLLSAFEREIDAFSAQKNAMQSEEKAIDIENKLVSVRESIAGLKAELEILENKLSQRKKQQEELEKHVKVEREKNVKYESIVSRINEKKEQIIRLNQQIENIKKDIEEKLKALERMPKIDIDSLRREERELLSDISEKNKVANEAYRRLSDLDAQYKGSKQRISQLNDEIEAIKKELAGISEKISRDQEIINNREKYLSIDEINGRIEQLNAYIEELEKEKENAVKSMVCPFCGSKLNDTAHISKEFDSRIDKLKSLIKHYSESKTNEMAVSLKQVNEELAVLSSRREDFSARVNKLSGERDTINLSSLESSLSDARKEYDNIMKQIDALNERKKIIDEELNNVEKQQEIRKEIDMLQARLDTLNSNITQSDQEIYKLSNELEMINFNPEELKSRELTLNELVEEISEINAAIARNRREVEVRESQIREYEDELKKLNEEIKKKKEIMEKLNHLVKIHDRLVSLREDIRGIREYVRNKFLNEFRDVFRMRFYEIRSEADYDVNIDNDYNVIISASNETLESKTLSGGEKTSVALAYRIALSSIISQLGGVSKNELLIMDEPTSGLDKEDVNSLASSIVKISGIKQIIIVTHDDTLKGIADRVIAVKKINGESVINISDY